MTDRTLCRRVATLGLLASGCTSGPVPTGDTGVSITSAADPDDGESRERDETPPILSDVVPPPIDLVAWLETL